MKNKQILLTLAVVAGLFIFSSNKSYAGGVVIWGEAEKIREIAELPDSEFYQTTDGQYFEMGVRYNTIHIFWIPLWVKTAPMVCGYVNKDTYVELSQDDIDEILMQTGIDLQGKVKASLWDKMGGKIVLLLVITLILLFYFRDKIANRAEVKES